MTLDASDVTAHGALPAAVLDVRGGRAALAARSTRSSSTAWSAPASCGRTRLEAWQRGIGRGAREAIAG